MATCIECVVHGIHSSHSHTDTRNRESRREGVWREGKRESSRVMKLGVERYTDI